LNDLDPDGDNLNVSGVSQPSNGSATFTIDYVFYTPDPDYNGDDSFTYTVEDDNGDSDTAIVNVSVTPVNDDPQAVDDYVSVPEDSSNNQIDVLLNDLDPEGDNLDITGATTPLHGSVTFTIDYVFYTPDPDYSGSDQFNYSISDNNGGSASGTVFVTVGGVNDPPVAVDDTAVVLEDSSNNQIDVLLNDLDPDGDNLTIISVSVPMHGSASTDGNYTYYSPNSNYFGDDSFTYTLSDGIDTDIATVNLTINGVNDPPVAFDDVTTVIEDSINNQIDVLANDGDIDGDSLIIVSVTDPENGSALTNSLYVFYTPDPDFSGNDQFDYEITDNNGGYDFGTVFVTVTGVNDPPIANDDYISVYEDSIDYQIDVVAK